MMDAMGEAPAVAFGAGVGGDEGRLGRGRGQGAGGEGDLKADLLESTGEFAGGTLGVEAIVAIAAAFPIGCALVDHGPDDGKNAVSDGYGGLLLAAPAGDTEEQGLQKATVG